MAGDEVGRVHFETNIAQVRDQVIKGMSEISAAVLAEQAKGARGRPADVAEFHVGSRMQQISGAAEQEIARIKAAFEQEGKRAKATGTPFVNPDPTGHDRSAGTQIQDVLKLTNAAMQQALTAVPEAVRAATGDFRALAQRQVVQLLHELEAVFGVVHGALKTAGLPTSALGGSTTRQPGAAAKALDQPITFDPGAEAAASRRLAVADLAANQAATRRLAEATVAETAASERGALSKDALTRAEGRLAISLEEAAARVHRDSLKPVGQQQYTRTGEGEYQHYKITDPMVTPPGASPFYEIVKPRLATEMDAGDPGGLQRIEERSRIQQLDKDILTTDRAQEVSQKALLATERERAEVALGRRLGEQRLAGTSTALGSGVHSLEDRTFVKETRLGARELDTPLELSNALVGQEAKRRKQRFDEQNRLYDQIYADDKRGIENRRIMLEDHQRAAAARLGTQLHQEREAGTAKDLGRGMYQLQGGSFVKREGESASYITAIGERVDALQALTKHDRQQLAQQQRLAAQAQAPEKPQGLIGGFAGGFFSQGFNATGVAHQSWGQDITNLAGTAGVLAKYSLAGAAIGAASASMAVLIKSTLDYDTEVQHLNVFLEGLSKSLGENTKLTVDFAAAQSAGIAVGMDADDGLRVGIAGIAAYSGEIRKGADANEVFQNTITQVGRAMLLTGQTADVAMRNLRAATAGFQTGSEGQAQVNDATAMAFRNFGGDRGDILTALAHSAQIGAESGLDANELANMVALVETRTGSTGAQVSSLIERLVARSGTGDFKAGMRQAGVTDTGDIGEELKGLSAYYNTLGESAQTSFLRQIAGGRALQSLLLPILKEQGELQDANARSADSVGAGAEAAYHEMESMAGSIKLLGAEAKTLMADIGKSGIFAAFGVAIKAVEPPLRLVTELLGAFDSKIPDMGRNIGGLIVDVGLLVLVMRKFATLRGGAAAGEAIGGGAAAAGLQAQTFKTLQAAQATAVLTAAEVKAAEAAALLGWRTAAEAETQAVATRAATAHAAALEAVAVASRAAATGEMLLAGATQAEAVANTTATKTRGSRFLSKGAGIPLLGVGAGAAVPLAIAAGALALVNLGMKADDLKDSLNKADDAMGELASTGGDVKALKQHLSDLGEVIAQVDHESKGFSGTIVNWLTGDSGGNKKRELEADAAETRAQIALREKAASASGAGRVSVFGPGGIPRDVEALTSGVKALRDSGANADTILRLLAQTINNLAGVGQAAVTKTRPGDLLMTEDADNFAITEAGNLSNLGRIDLRSLDLGRRRGGYRAAQEIFNKTTRPDVDGPESYNIVTGEDLNLTAKEVEGYRLAQRRKLKELGKDKVGSVITPAEQLAVVEAGVASLTRVLDGIDGIGPLLVQAALKSMKARAKQPITEESLAKNPLIIQEATQLAIAEQGNRRSAATATGADASERLQVEVTGLQVLKEIAAAGKRAGGTADNLEQTEHAITVAGKDLFDAYQAKVEHLVAVATKSLGNSAGDQAKKRRIELQAAAILTLANATDPTLLSGAFNNLDQAQALLAQAAINQAGNVAGAAALLIANARRQAGVLRAQADRYAAIANAAMESGDARTEIRNQGEADKARAEAQLGLDEASKIAAELRKPPRLLNPDAQYGIDQSVSAANKDKAAKDAGDTAAQIAAAAYAATIFPGDKVGEAAAALKTAAANLAAAKRNTVAYYNAVKELRSAEQSYANAVLDAQNTSRLLGLDRTNPLLVAHNAARAALAKLRKDIKAGADRNTINEDQIAYRDAQANLEQTAFDQRLQQAQVNDQLGRTSHAAYLAYLQHEHDRLSAIAVKTYQQTQMLNTIDQLMLDAANALSGQFNLGDIKLPSVYEVRRSLVAQSTGMATGSTRVQNVNITVSGGDVAVIKSVLATYLGPGAFARSAVTSSKV